MQQVLIIGARRESDALIRALQGAGVLHVSPLEGAELEGHFQTGGLGGEQAEGRRTTERLLARVESTLAELRVAQHPELRATALPHEHDWEALAEAAAQPATDVTRRLGEVQSDRDAAAAYCEVVSALAELTGGLETSRRVSVVPFTAVPDRRRAAEFNPTAAFAGEFGDEFALSTRTLPNGTVVGAVAVPPAARDRVRAALTRLGAGELRLPGRFEGMPYAVAAEQMAQIQERGPAAAEELERERQALAARHGPALLALQAELGDRVAVFDTEALGARGRYSLALRGYVPSDRLPALQQALGQFGDRVAYETAPADPHHDHRVPTELNNRGYFARMQMLTGLFPPPRYGTFDPTTVIAIAFPLFFGFIIADIAYGLLFWFIAARFAAMAREGRPLEIGFLGFSVPAPTLDTVSYIIKWMAGWSILFGFLTGEFLGTFFEHLYIFHVSPAWLNTVWGWTGASFSDANLNYVADGLIPITLPRYETSFVSILLVISLAVGVLHVLLGWATRVRTAMAHGSRVHFWEGVGMFAGIVGLVALSFTYMSSGDFGALTNAANPLNLLMYLAFAVFLLGVVMSRIPLMIMELISNGGAILSYSRLMAVGIASAVLARLATDVGWDLYTSIGVAGAIIGIVLALLIHFLALLFTIIGHVVQPLRLNYVEYLTRTGFYDEAGIPYNPLRRAHAAAALEPGTGPMTQAGAPLPQGGTD